MKKKTLIVLVLVGFVFCSLVMTNLYNKTKVHVAEEKEPTVFVVKPKLS